MIDRRNLENGTREMNKNNLQATSNGMNGRGTDIRNNRRYVDVVHGASSNRKKEEINKEGGVRHEYTNRVKEGRIIDIDEEEFNGEVINRSLIGEVKKACFLPKLPSFCEAQGLNKVEVKLLGGYDVRLTWVNIIGVPVSCWTESVFKRIVEVHGSIVGLKNCKLEGKSDGDITTIEIEDANVLNVDEQEDRGSFRKTIGDAMVISNNEDDGDSINGSNGEDDDLENGEGNNPQAVEEEQEHRSTERDDRKDEDDEESRISGKSRVREGNGTNVKEESIEECDHLGMESNKSACVINNGQQSINNGEKIVDKENHANVKERCMRK
nr:transposon TX1 [Tanacetum cinerariifolium]